MRIIILFLLTILTVNNTIAQQPTKEQAEIQKKLNERLLKDQKEAQEKESKNKNKTNVGVKWTGTMTSETIIIHSNAAYNGKVEIHGTASFADALPTMYRDIETTDLNFTDDKGVGSHIVNSEITDMTGKKCVGACNGNGQAELHAVVINEETNTYDIEVIFPGCVGTGNCKDDGVYIADDLEAIVSDYPLGTNKDVLSGSKKVTAELPGGLGTVTNTITWNLVRSKPVDVELIVKPEETPAGYEKWVPIPGINELNKGSVMNISLELRSKNGKPLTVKVESFELTLSNTSKEPGITINYPVEPDAKQLPDLRFILLPGIESIDEDQFITVGSPDGTTGKAMIASYDGGGWATLTVEAILEKDKRRIKGQLFVSGGEEDILIPKRVPGTKIALAWSKANGKPNDMDDKENVMDNSHDGDGLTAYEEYRGVIAEGKYRRLDPNKKEVGIQATKADFNLFNEGIGWFKNASNLEPVRFDFDRNEIAPDGRLNKNGKTNHSFDQYAIYILNGGLGGDGTLGATYSRSKPHIPANVISIIIDWNYIQPSYLRRANAAKPEILKFTLQEYQAQTVAHELGHAVNIPHHGADDPKDFAIDSNDRIIYRNGNLMDPLPNSLRNIGDSIGTVEGGNISCMLNYYPYFSWAHTIAGGRNIYNQEPLLSIGRIFCKSENGTGINATKLYFGKAGKDKGNCFGKIQLKN
jgi:hypothetical protein